jgi:hypothetical protein
LLSTTFGRGLSLQHLEIIVISQQGGERIIKNICIQIIRIEPSVIKTTISSAQQNYTLHHVSIKNQREYNGGHAIKHAADKKCTMGAIISGLDLNDISNEDLAALKDAILLQAGFDVVY